MHMKKILESHYTESFDSAYAFAMTLIDMEKEHGVAQIRGTLRSLYVRQGNDIDGRGHFGDSDIEATIAAYELALANQEERLPANGEKTEIAL